MFQLNNKSAIIHNSNSFGAKFAKISTSNSSNNNSNENYDLFISSKSEVEQFHKKLSVW